MIQQELGQKLRKHKKQPKPMYLRWFGHIQPPIFRHLGHQKRMPRPTRRRAFDFLQIFSDFGEIGRSRGGPTNHFFGHFFNLAPLGVPWRAQGRQNTPKDTKMTSKLTTRVPILQKHRKTNEPQNDKKQPEIV